MQSVSSFSNFNSAIKLSNSDMMLQHIQINEQHKVGLLKIVKNVPNVLLE
jgi:hypothetical protein